jgi:hypothetical protein
MRHGITAPWRAEEFMPSRQIVVTLTSIPPRFSNLPRKLASIGRQTVRPDRVEVHLPRAYRRFPGERPSLPPLPDWVEVVETDIDLGPATKVLPAATRWRGTETDLLLCDDDRLQDRHWLSRFVAGRAERPHDIICKRGLNIEEKLGIARTAQEQPRAVLAQNRGRTWAYRLQKILSLTLYHPLRQVYATSGYADIFEGFLGALVPVDAFPDLAWEIPGVLWTQDDVWLSGMACKNGTKVWVNGVPRPVFSNTHMDKLAALTNHVEERVDRDAVELLGVNFPRAECGVWP